MEVQIPRGMKRRHGEMSSGGTDRGNFSTPSSGTKRRKIHRRQLKSGKSSQELTDLRRLFQHVEVLGRVAPYAKLNPQLVIADPDPIILDYTKINPPPVPNLDPSRFTFVKACTPVEMAHLRHFDHAIHIPDNEYCEAIGIAAEITLSLLSLPQYLLFPNKEALSEVRYWPQKFAGIEYARMGLKSRGDADPIAQVDAERAFDKLMAGERVVPHDVRLGGRGKIAKLTAEQAQADPPPVGRLILMMSHRDLKLCGITENQLTSAYGEDRYPIAVGLSWYHGGVYKFLERMRPYDIWMCFDAKKFDSSINPWMVAIAINILRAQYMEGDAAKYDAYWEFVRESLLEAPIFRDDGVRFGKKTGTTSGHSHNTLIQSIITLMLGYAAMAILHPDMSLEEIMGNMWIESLGDDNIMALRGPLAHHTVEEVSEVMWAAFRVDWGGKKSFATTRLLDPGCGGFQGIQFLGKYFYLGDYPTGSTLARVPIPYRPAEETYLRLLYPEYGTLERSQTYLRVLGNYIDAAGNREMEVWLQGLLTWMDVAEDEVPDEWPSSFKRMVARDYSNVGIEVPAPQRLSFEQWRDLVVLDKGVYRGVWPRARRQAL